MNSHHPGGQTLVESVIALGFLLTLFFLIFYTFLMGMEKIRSLDIVYHLARIRQVQQSDSAFYAKNLVALSSLGGSGIPQISSRGGSGPVVNEVRFRFFNGFGPLSGTIHTSLMRTAQPDIDYLNKSYPGGAQDTGAPNMATETLALEALARANSDSLADAAEDIDAAVEASRS